MARLYPAERFLPLHASELTKLLKGLPLAKSRPVRLAFDEAEKAWTITYGGANFLQYQPDYSMMLEIAAADARSGHPMTVTFRPRDTAVVVEQSRHDALKNPPQFPPWGSGKGPLRLPAARKPEASPA